MDAEGGAVVGAEEGVVVKAAAIVSLCAAGVGVAMSSRFSACIILYLKLLRAKSVFSPANIVGPDVVRLISCAKRLLMV